jgi:GDP-mannose transporter
MIGIPVLKMAALVMYYNNLLTIPVLIVASTFFEDWSSANVEKNFPAQQRNSIIMAMLLSGLSTIFITYTSGWCVRVTSSTTYSMVGALNKLPIAISGLIFFDAPVTFGSVSAILVGFVSGLVYAWAKVRQSIQSRNTLPISHPTVGASGEKT